MTFTFDPHDPYVVVHDEPPASLDGDGSNTLAVGRGGGNLFIERFIYIDRDLRRKNAWEKDHLQCTKHSASSSGAIAFSCKYSPGGGSISFEYSLARGVTAIKSGAQILRLVGKEGIGRPCR
ncbi:hypothetical protein OMP43_02065 [Sphingomonas sp. CBMAI 2297]|uniref:hypothetical protein n=1 Tax=Sphingomonas sp. CBMAI 2297 TaxID=2991720 RepID=UPI002458A648|nr:hypothetical protein [Sphingomonas sp. CBMAI 2297]MDH4742796.1 hypothetical protein [Sphingomonas sp. CBMAI 2297]